MGDKSKKDKDKQQKQKQIQQQAAAKNCARKATSAGAKNQVGTIFLVLIC